MPCRVLNDKMDIMKTYVTTCAVVSDGSHIHYGALDVCNIIMMKDRIYHIAGNFCGFCGWPNIHENLSAN